MVAMGTLCLYFGACTVQHGSHWPDGPDEPLKWGKWGSSEQRCTVCVS